MGTEENKVINSLAFSKQFIHFVTSIFKTTSFKEILQTFTQNLKRCRNICYFGGTSMSGGRNVPCWRTI
jgi:type IV secretory pathway VirB3-like protein